MGIIVKNTNYNGEVLEKILTVATTGNELVSKGLIDVIPGVEKKVSVPRLKTGTMLQKRKENPTIEDGKGDFKYSEKELDPKDMMVFAPFSPRTFEAIWRKWQPTGDLVYSQLPPEAQNALLEALLKQVTFELGWQYVNGTYGSGDKSLMDGIITQIAKDNEVQVVNTSATTMTDRLKAVRKRIPASMRANPALRILMSINDFDEYDDERTKREYKNADETKVNSKMYKEIPIETLAVWPEGLIIATLCSPDSDSNLFAAVNLQDDEHVVQVEKVSNMSELYFFKLLMKADTQIAFGEEVIVLDFRTSPVFASHVTATPSSLTFDAAGGTQSVQIAASGEYSVSANPTGYTVEQTDEGIKVTADANTSKTTDVTGKITLALTEDATKKCEISLTTSKSA